MRDSPPPLRYFTVLTIGVGVVGLIAGLLPVFADAFSAPDTELVTVAVALIGVVGALIALTQLRGDIPSRGTPEISRLNVVAHAGGRPRLRDHSRQRQIAELDSILDTIGAVTSHAEGMSDRWSVIQVRSALKARGLDVRDFDLVVRTRNRVLTDDDDDQPSEDELKQATGVARDLLKAIEHSKPHGLVITGRGFAGRNWARLFVLILMPTLSAALGIFASYLDSTMGWIAFALCGLAFLAVMNVIVMRRDL